MAEIGYRRATTRAVQSRHCGTGHRRLPHRHRTDSPALSRFQSQRRRCAGTTQGHATQGRWRDPGAMMTSVNDIDAIPAPTRLPAVIALAAAIAGPRRGRDRAAALALAGDALRACGPHARILVSGRGADNNGRDVDDKRRDVDDKRRDVDDKRRDVDDKRRDELVALW